jgi:PhzF family phenazine biosynthesis protein
MKLPIWQIDAFSNVRLAGNPAAVVPLEAWLPDETLLAIAGENNLSETAYLLAEGADFQIRWFTPVREVPLCGHATLASAWVVFNRLQPSRKRVVFSSQSGPLPVDLREDGKLELDFPGGVLEPAPPSPALVAALGREPRELHSGWQWLALYDSEAEVRALKPDMAGIVAAGVYGIMATAPGTDSDFVSRFFAPGAGIPEDPVTGSAHTRLAPFWAKRLNKTSLHARQVSARGGELWCELRGQNRVGIAGHAVLFLEGAIEL